MTGSGVAVVIPAYRCAAVVRDAVRSVLEQTLPPDEIVVVDDCSPDDIRGALAGLDVQYLRRASNGGPGAARNAGIRATRAPLVAFLDADDLWLPDKLRQQVGFLAQHPEAVAVSCDAFVQRPDGSSRRFNEGRPYDPVVTAEALLLQNPVPTLTVVARREAVTRAGGFDEDREMIAVEDVDLWLKLVEIGPFLRMPEPLGVYRRVVDGIGSPKRFLDGTAHAFDKFLARHPHRRDYHRIVRRQRGVFRRNFAWECLRQGRYGQAAWFVLASLRYDPMSAQALRILGATLLARIRSVGSRPRALGT